VPFQLSRSRRPEWQHRLRENQEARRATYLKLAINAVGALATGVALLIIITAKFVEGAWLTLIVIPAAVGLLVCVRRYYDDLDRQILTGTHRLIDVRRGEPPVVFVPINDGIGLPGGRLSTRYIFPWT
jgi:hypothetical protein